MYNMMDNGGCLTTPPMEPPGSARRQWRRWLAGTASALLTPLARRFAPHCIGGQTVSDAIGVAQSLAAEGLPSTLGFWPLGDETAQQMTDCYLASISAVAEAGVDGEISIKPPAVRFDGGLASVIARCARAKGVRLHCDSHGIEVVAARHRMIEMMLGQLSPTDIGTTLPGRWCRSLEDADWAIERGLRIRVVKGQWSDPDDPDRDLGLGYLEVIDRLAGRAHHVAVATHDLPLMKQAIARLQAAGNDYEVQIIFGAASGPVMRWARQNGVPLRVYIPYGNGFVPNAVSQLVHNPRLAWRLLKSMATLQGAEERR